MVDIWEAFFKIKRSPMGLFMQTKNLAAQNNISIIIGSAPKRDRKNWRQPFRETTRANKSKPFEKILWVINDEIRKSTRHATRRIMKIIEEVIEENKELKEEIKTLRPYKNIVENNYRNQKRNLE